MKYKARTEMELVNPSSNMPRQLDQYPAGRAEPRSFNVFFHTTLNSLPGEKIQRQTKSTLHAL